MENLLIDYDLFIFDLDDTIVKTEKYHYEAWIKTLQHFVTSDFNISYDFFCSKFHSIIENSIKLYLVNELKIDPNMFEEICTFKTQTYLGLLNNYYKNQLKFIEGLEIFLNKIIELQKEFVIVTNTNKCNLDFFIETFPILKKATRNYYKELFVHKKPNPECYLKVVSDFPDKKKVAFEDSITGIHALSLVPNIATVFINTSDYYHFHYIQSNYRLAKTITNYIL